MAEMIGAQPTMLDTGVPNLDLVLGGGLQQHNSYIIAGLPGTGKSVLAEQIAFHRVRQGDRILLITGLDEPHHNLLEHLTTFRFADIRMIGPQIETISIVPFLDAPVDEKINVLRRTVLNARPQMVLLDGFRSLETFLGGEQGMYQFLYGLTSWFAVERITLLLTKEVDAQAGGPNPEFGLVDGVLAMRRDVVGGRVLRRLSVRKMRGQKPLDGLHTITIGEDGVTVWPRPQATFRLEDRPWSNTRLAFGIPTFDRILGGGLPEATSTLLAGDPGTGKTTLGLAFLSNGVHEGQPGLWVGFRESRSDVIGASRQWGADLTEADEQGRVSFLTMAPAELDPDRLAGMMQDRAAELGARRLVLDAAEVLDDAFPSPRDATAFLNWLVQSLPRQGVTTVVTHRAPRPPGQAFDVSNLPGGALVDNAVLLRQVRRGSQLHRAIAVVKMNRPGYDAAIREFTLDQYGITVGEALSGEVEQPALRASSEPVRGPA
jgi:circadian clock protein KaiC